MKISEKLAITRRQEGELIRLYELRESIAKQSFRESTIRVEKETIKDIEKRQKEFLENKKSKVEEIDKRVRQLTMDIVESKKNVEIGIDRKLAEIKYLRIELSKLMKLAKVSSYSDSFDADVFEQLGLSVKIKELEEQKQKLDNEIQKTNWSVEI